MNKANRNMESHDTSFIINFGCKKERPIRISLPDPPPLELIDGFGKPKEEQYFRRLEWPKAIVELEREVYDEFKDKQVAINYDIQNRFWELLEKRKKSLKDEILFMKKFIWHMHHGYWWFNAGKPTYMTGWNFSYLHLHYMTLRKGEGYPEYDERQRRRFLFRHYTWTTTETFADLDSNGRAIKADGKYRMKDLGTRTFYGTIEPKGRREGLTNEFCHIVTRIMTESYGADNLGTVVSMDGDNASTHFKKKLVPAFKRWPIWLKPIWQGGVTAIDFNPGKRILDPNAIYLGSSINYTESGSDVANDGKKILAAGYDEQGKGKRIGDVGNRWQINKETMSLEAGADILGWCMHPSTVEKMNEGGQDYKEMVEISDFYTRGPGGQTLSGLALSYMPTSFCLRGFTDKFGNPVLFEPTPFQQACGYKRGIGSKKWIQQRRNMMYDEANPKKMDEFRSFVRKFPEDILDCWKGVAGFIGFPLEQIENRIIDLDNEPQEVRGKLEWVNNRRFGQVKFVEDEEGDWLVTKVMQPHESGIKTTMDYYSAFEDDLVEMYRPLRPQAIVGLDPHEFKNEGESKRLKHKGSRLSDTGIAVVGLRDKNVDKDDFNPQTWTTVKTWGILEKRFSNNKEVAEEALKAAIYWNALIHIERNKTEVWSLLVDWLYGGYLNHMAEILPRGELQIQQEPGSFMSTQSKKKMFSYAKDHFVNHIQNEGIRHVLRQAVEISSMEDLTKYDALAALLNAIMGTQSLYHEIMTHWDVEEEMTNLNFYGRAV